MSDAEDRLERLRQLESLRRIAQDVANGMNQGLAEALEEGRQIVAAREAALARGEARNPHRRTPTWRRRRRNDGSMAAVAVGNVRRLTILRGTSRRREVLQRTAGRWRTRRAVRSTRPTICRRTSCN
jgi:hypothetical protein